MAPNIYAYRGRHLLSLYNDQNKDVPGGKLSDLDFTPCRLDRGPVCIIGAGMAGLYTAMILQSLDIKYHIVDANTRKRIGGRLFTHRFLNGGSYDYFDVGAMRYPDTPFMKRFFDLVRNRHLDVKLIPYIWGMKNTWMFYNNVRVNNDPNMTGDPFGVRAHVTDQDLTTPQGVNKKVAEVVQPFRDMFRPQPNGEPPNIATAMKDLFEETNNFSMRSYMLIMRGMRPKDVNWCETLQTATGWYDRALTQVVIGTLATKWPDTPLPGPEDSPSPNWYCIDGGSSRLPQAMFASLSEEAQQEALFESPVTAISRGSTEGAMRISIKGVQSPQEYSAVISTVPLPCLGLMDLTGANIHNNYPQWSAIRALQYGPSAKVGLKFSDPWWETLPKPIFGGQSSTDLTLRKIVYPSYPPGGGEGSKVLIVSYTHTEDAQRIGALIRHDGTVEEAFMNLIFRDLAAVHDLGVDDIKGHYTGDYFAWDWSGDPLAMGGYAFFSPGVYGDEDIYGALLQPAANYRLFFAGEAASACHGWVEGALDSAWRAVNQCLTIHEPHRLEQFRGMWGRTEYWDETYLDGTFDEDLVESDRELAERFLAIALQKDGVTVKSS